MPITLNFIHADGVVSHLRQLVSSATDPLIVGLYSGFITVSAVCSFEIAIKEIFTTFAQQKHPVLGNVTKDRFERISGKVAYKALKEDYVPMFGDKYADKFKKRIQKRSKEFLRLHGRDIVSAYNNIIIWRNDFVHAGKNPSTATFNEVIQAYEDGKLVIECLNNSMHR